MEFKSKVRHVRAELQLSQEQLAKELGCVFSTVNRWEQGRKPSFLLENKFNSFCKMNGIDFARVGVYES
ncbi:MAG: helix-turn-helix domain-containing protein [Firmicutes bacterium]|nr:helix-turn-helix domain-containing protein [Bacillota bacterium]